LTLQERKQITALHHYNHSPKMFYQSALSFIRIPNRTYNLVVKLAHFKSNILRQL